MYKTFVFEGCQVALHIPQTTQKEDLSSFHNLFRQIVLDTLLREKEEENAEN